MTEDEDIDAPLAPEEIDQIVMRERRVPTAAEIEELTCLWARLLPEVDFHRGKWFAPDEAGTWQQVSAGNVPDLLADLEVPDVAEVVEQFRRRDKKTAIPHKVKHEAQLRLGIC